jgi:hypothetical protein
MGVTDMREIPIAALLEDFVRPEQRAISHTCGVSGRPRRICVIASAATQSTLQAKAWIASLLRSSP